MGPNLKNKLAEISSAESSSLEHETKNDIKPRAKRKKAKIMHSKFV